MLKFYPLLVPDSNEILWFLFLNFLEYIKLINYYYQILVRKQNSLLLLVLRHS